MVNGFNFRFSSDCVSTLTSTIAKKQASTLKYSDIINTHIQEGLRLNRILGPFSHPPFDPFISSPLGVVPKLTPGQFRIIHDLSYPKDNSGNANIPKENSAVQYDSIDLIINLVQENETNCLMAMTDIKDIFRIVPINLID